VTIRLKVDLTFLALDAVQWEGGGPGPRTLEDLARIGVVTNILQADLDKISPQWSSLLTSLGNLVNLAGSIAQVRGITASNNCRLC